MTQESHGFSPVECQDALEKNPIRVDEMNELAVEAVHFQKEMAQALQDGVRFDDEQVFRLIEQHLTFLQQHGHKITADEFAAQTQFFLEDDFHRQVLAEQQPGLPYFLHIAAKAFATR
jgi:hypothetical protein